MQIQQIVGSGDPERVLVGFKNVDGSGSITTGRGIAFVGAGASVDGINAIKSTAAGIKSFAGIAVRDVPINGYGLAVVWGVANSVELSNVGTSITITLGNTMIPGAVAGTFFSGITNEAISTLMYKYITVMDTATISATAYVRGFVRAL